MNSTPKSASPAIVGDPSIGPVTAPLTQSQPIDQDASGSEDENSDDEWEDEEGDEEDECADEDDFPTWDGGIPRARLEKTVAGDPSGPKKKVVKKDTGSKSGDNTDGTTDDTTDDMTDGERRDGGSGSGSSTLQPVVGQDA